MVELVLIALVVYVAFQTVMIPIAIIRGEKVTWLVIVYLVAIAAAYFTYTYLAAGSGSILS